jgi:hypothetical protein
MPRVSQPFTPFHALTILDGGTLTCVASTTNTITTAVPVVSTDICLCFPSILTTMTTTFKAVYATASTFTVTGSAATLTSDRLFWIVLRATT